MKVKTTPKTTSTAIRHDKISLHPRHVHALVVCFVPGYGEAGYTKIPTRPFQCTGS